MRKSTVRKNVSKKLVSKRRSSCVSKTVRQSEANLITEDLTSTSLNKQSRNLLTEYNSYQNRVNILEKELAEAQILNKKYARELDETKEKVKGLENELQFAYSSADELETYKQKLIDKYRQHLNEIYTRFNSSDLIDRSTNTEEVWTTITSDSSFYFSGCDSFKYK